MADYGLMAQGAQEYGQMGYQVGGVYGAIIGAVVGVFIGNKKGKEQQKAFDKYNDMVMKNAATQLFDARRQFNVQQKATANALSAYQDEKAVAQASYTAAFGAADMIGGSTTALNQAMDYQTQQAQAAVWQNYGIAIDNHNVLLNSLTQQAEAKFRRTLDKPNGGLDMGGMFQSGMSMFGGGQGGQGGGMFGGSRGQAGQIPIESGTLTK